MFGNALFISLYGWLICMLMDYGNVAAICHYPKRLKTREFFFFKLITSEAKKTNEAKGSGVALKLIISAFSIKE